MYGVINGVQICNLFRNEELNLRIAERNVPSNDLAPQFSMRPVSTKYSLMPIIDPIVESKVTINHLPPYNIQNTFNPGTSQGPWSGFSNNVNDESKLRNQFFALQNCPHTSYIPSTTSDMYNVKVEGKPIPQTHPELFRNEEFSDFNPNICNTGYNLFNNCTRQQLKDYV